MDPRRGGVPMSEEQEAWKAMMDSMAKFIGASTKLMTTLNAKAGRDATLPQLQCETECKTCLPDRKPKCAATSCVIHGPLNDLLNTTQAPEPQMAKTMLVPPISVSPTHANAPTEISSIIADPGNAPPVDKTATTEAKTPAEDKPPGADETLYNTALDQTVQDVTVVEEKKDEVTPPAVANESPGAATPDPQTVPPGDSPPTDQTVTIPPTSTATPQPTTPTVPPTEPQGATPPEANDCVCQSIRDKKAKEMGIDVPAGKRGKCRCSERSKAEQSSQHLCACPVSSREKSLISDTLMEKVSQAERDVQQLRQQLQRLQLMDSTRKTPAASLYREIMKDSFRPGAQSTPYTAAQMAAGQRSGFMSGFPGAAPVGAPQGNLTYTVPQPPSSVFPGAVPVRPPQANLTYTVPQPPSSVFPGAAPVGLPQANLTYTVSQSSNYPAPVCPTSGNHPNSKCCICPTAPGLSDLSHGRSGPGFPGTINQPSAGPRLQPYDGSFGSVPPDPRSQGYPDLQGSSAMHEFYGTPVGSQPQIGAVTEPAGYSDYGLPVQGSVGDGMQGKGIYDADQTPYSCGQVQSNTQVYDTPEQPSVYVECLYQKPPSPKKKTDSTFRPPASSTRRNVPGASAMSRPSGAASAQSGQVTAPFQPPASSTRQGGPETSVMGPYTIPSSGPSERSWPSGAATAPPGQPARAFQPPAASSRRDFADVSPLGPFRPQRLNFDDTPVLSPIHPNVPPEVTYGGTIDSSGQPTGSFRPPAASSRPRCPGTVYSAGTIDSAGQLTGPFRPVVASSRRPGAPDSTGQQTGSFQPGVASTGRDIPQGGGFPGAMESSVQPTGSIRPVATSSRCPGAIDSSGQPTGSIRPVAASSRCPGAMNSAGQATGSLGPAASPSGGGTPDRELRYSLDFQPHFTSSRDDMVPPAPVAFVDSPRPQQRATPEWRRYPVYDIYNYGQQLLANRGDLSDSGGSESLYYSSATGTFTDTSISQERTPPEGIRSPIYDIYNYGRQTQATRGDLTASGRNELPYNSSAPEAFNDSPFPQERIPPEGIRSPIYDIYNYGRQIQATRGDLTASGRNELLYNSAEYVPQVVDVPGLLPAAVGRTVVSVRGITICSTCDDYGDQSSFPQRSMQSPRSAALTPARPPAISAEDSDDEDFCSENGCGNADCESTSF